MIAQIRFTTLRRISPWLFSAILIAILLALRPTTAWAIDTCYAVADEGDRFVSLNKTTGKTADIGPTGVLDIEAIAFEANSATLYAANAAQMGTINLLTGKFTVLNSIGVVRAADGVAVTIDDLDGLSWDPTSNVLYAVQRQIPPPGSGLPDELFPDLLLQIDLATGKLKPGVFSGADFVEIGVTSKLEADVDDIAINPYTGVIYGIENDGGKYGTLIIINKQSGAITEVGPLVYKDDPTTAVDDMEGLAFFNDGQLYGSTGDRGPDLADQNRLFTVDPATGQSTLVAPFPAQYKDYEALDCLTATIADDDEDSIVNIGEDSNGNGDLADDDTDGDGIPNYLDPDDDNDQVPTSLEDPNGNGNPLDDDTDRDNLPNYLDPDDDGDGVLTQDEDSNGDGNLFNDDDDADSVPNFLEGGDSDSDGIPNQNDPDDDNDGVLTRDENIDGKDGPTTDDTDLDGIPNYLDDDDDNDTIPTKVERTGPQPDDVDNDGLPNYLDTDSDDDGLTDNAEFSSGPNDRLRGCSAENSVCFDNDADKDGLSNYVDIDSDGDGTFDKDELGDADLDGIPDWLDTDVVPVNSRIYMPIVQR